MAKRNPRCVWQLFVKGRETGEWVRLGTASYVECDINAARGTLAGWHLHDRVAELRNAETGHRVKIT
jgi:hypothetical protein